ncbi:Gfo/Idh/MocA family oxidoreductase [Stieleria sp. TO1_6]|nr:Gfo/Idh/MocA family oxidoreductase [Stieleria tagensis]
MNPALNLSRRQILAAAPAFLVPLTGWSTAVGAGPNAKPRIRIGQIGTKHAHAEGKLQTILKHPETFEFVGLVEPDAQRRQRLQQKPLYRDLPWVSEDELLGSDGLQAVAVETQIADLVPTAMRCLSAGMHLHLDKPAGESLQACRAMHDLATDRGRTIQMGYMLRYNPAFQFAHRLVRDGWLGQITEVSGMMGKYMGDAGRIELAQYSGGGMFELACHLIDQLVSLLGPPEKVTAHTRRTFPEKDSFADNQMAVFDYPQAIATIRCNHIDPMGGSRRSFSITGTEGTFAIRPLEPAPVARLGLDRPRDGYIKGYQEVRFEKPAGRYDAEFLDLAAVIRGEKTLDWDAAHDVATHEAILRSCEMLDSSS